MVLCYLNKKLSWPLQINTLPSGKQQIMDACKSSMVFYVSDVNYMFFISSIIAGVNVKFSCILLGCFFYFFQSEEHMNRLDREIREIERVGKKADRGTIYCACGVLGLVIGLILVFVYILWCKHINFNFVMIDCWSLWKIYY